MADHENVVGRALARWVLACASRPRGVVALAAALSLVLGVYAARSLGIDSDNTRMVSEDLPSSRAHRRFSELFPILDNALLVVVDGPSPAAASDAADLLQARLEAEPEHFREVYQPGGGSFFERNGLLYRSVDELDEVADQLLRMQPILAELERDPSIASFSLMVRRGLDQARESQLSPREWAEVLDTIRGAAVAVHAEVPVEVSWDSVLLRGSALETSTRRVLVVDPVLDFGHILPAAAPLGAIDAASRELGLPPTVSIRVTGNPALNHEEMISIAWDIGIGGGFCFLLVTFLIHRAFRSRALAAAALATLLVGLVFTSAFAAAAVGHLNIVSVTFAILFIGLGIDFPVHLGMRYAALRRGGAAHLDALRDSAQSVGSSLLICTLTTAIGFFVFVPTDYRGVAELGLIAGTGMAVSLFTTLTLFPALISSVFRLESAVGSPEALRFQGRWFRPLVERAAGVRAGAALAGLAALALVPAAEFDPDVLRLRDPGTQSAQAFEDLLAENGVSSPWFANVVAPDLDAAEALAGELRALPAVGRTLTLRDYVPRDQAEKREILADVSLLLAAPASKGARGSALTPAEQLTALAELRDFLAEMPVHGSQPLDASVRALRAELSRFLAAAERAPEPAAVLASLEASLLAPLPRSLARLRRALEPQEVELAGLPAELRRRMLAPDGQARIQVFPASSLGERLALEGFVDAIHAVAPGATGLAPNIVSFGHVTVSSLRQALVSAVVAIALLLFLLWRRASDVLFVLAPLLLGAACTVGAMVLLDLHFTFANVIVIPLLLGMGVDSGIHLVHRVRERGLAPGELMATTTARAVFFSALTTLVSFGSLAFSSHRGLQGLGAMLVVGLVFTLLATLVVLPSLLAWGRVAVRPAAGSDAVGLGSDDPRDTT